MTIEYLSTNKSSGWYKRYSHPSEVLGCDIASATGNRREHRKMDAGAVFAVGFDLHGREFYAETRGA